jgi:hypothetical protein
MFIHVLGVGVFLFVHGISGGVSFLLRGPVTASTRSLLRFSQITSQASNPALLVVLATGVWMVFEGHWASKIWPWAALAILIVTLGFMVVVARPYYVAREAAKGPDDVLATRLAAARPQLAAAVGVVALVILFALMVFKPF